MLFPWARAVNYSSSFGLEFFAPSWRRFRVRPYVYGYKDKRQYQRFMWQPTFAERFDQLKRMRQMKVIDEDGRVLHDRRGRETLLVTKGMRDYFSSFCDNREVISEAFWRCIRKAPATPHDQIADVVLHVRLGDFVGSNVDRDTGRALNTISPLSWFCGQLDAVRESWPSAKVVVCSDGTDDELRPLLMTGLVSRSSGDSALDDLRLMSNASLVIGSGSTFSAWGSFLGGVAMLLAPGMNHFLQGSPLVIERMQVTETELENVRLSESWSGAR